MLRRQQPALASALAVLLAALALAKPGLAQPRYAVQWLAEGAPPRAYRDESSARSLRETVGLASQRERLEESDSRSLALLRLSALGTTRALRVLTQWLESQPELPLQQWLQVCRALAPHAQDVEVRRWLARILTGAPLAAAINEVPSDAPLAEQCRAMAALGLARAGDRESLNVLSQALRQTGQAAHWAGQALLAHPPRQLGPLLKTAGAPSAELIATLDQLGDLRAFDTLREYVRTGTADVQAQAALALFHHGHLETVAVAQHWAKQATSHAGLLAAASEILLAVDNTPAPVAAGTAAQSETNTANAQSDATLAAVVALLQLEPTRALGLLARYPLPAAAPAVAQRFELLEPQAQRAALRTLALMGGPAAEPVLMRALEQKSLQLAAAQALAHSRDAALRDALLRALQRPTTTLLAVRALVARAWQTGERWPQLQATLQRLSKLKAPESRALGVWGLAVFSEQYALQQLKSEDVTTVAAVASTSLVHSAAFSRALTARGQAVKNPKQRAALSSGLSYPGLAREVASSQLHALISAVPPLALSLAPELSGRLEPLRPARVLSWFEAQDPELRAAALLGLGQYPRAENVGRLWLAYFGETALVARQTALLALAAQPASVHRDEVLRFAVQYDPDPLIRSAARAGLGGAVPPSAVRGHALAWLDLPKAAAEDLVLVRTSAGRSVPLLLPPGNQLLLLGLPSADVQHSITGW